MIINDRKGVERYDKSNKIVVIILDKLLYYNCNYLSKMDIL